jgi:heme O synthase-like polyprenyltransferase
MSRIATPRIARNTISREEALAFGLVLAGSAVAVLSLGLNVSAGILIVTVIVGARFGGSLWAITNLSVNTGEIC